MKSFDWKQLDTHTQSEGQSLIKHHLSGKLILIIVAYGLSGIFIYLVAGMFL